MSVGEKKRSLPLGFSQFADRRTTKSHGRPPRKSVLEVGSVFKEPRKTELPEHIVQHNREKAWAMIHSSGRPVVGRKKLKSAKPSIGAHKTKAQPRLIHSSEFVDFCVKSHVRITSSCSLEPAFTNADRYKSLRSFLGSFLEVVTERSAENIDGSLYTHAYPLDRLPEKIIKDVPDGMHEQVATLLDQRKARWREAVFSILTRYKYDASPFFVVFDSFVVFAMTHGAFGEVGASLCKGSVGIMSERDMVPSEQDSIGGQSSGSPQDDLLVAGDCCNCVIVSASSLYFRQQLRRNNIFFTAPLGVGGKLGRMSSSIGNILKGVSDYSTPTLLRFEGRKSCAAFLKFLIEYVTKSPGFNEDVPRLISDAPFLHGASNQPKVSFGETSRVEGSELRKLFCANFEGMITPRVFNSLCSQARAFHSSLAGCDAPLTIKTQIDPRCRAMGMPEALRYSDDAVCHIKLLRSPSAEELDSADDNPLITPPDHDKNRLWVVG